MRYEAGFGFMIDVEDTTDERGNSAWEAWLYRKGYGIKSYIIDLVREQFPTLKAAMEYIKAKLLQEFILYDQNYVHEETDQRYLFIAEMTEKERERVEELYEHMGHDISDILSDVDNNYLRYEDGGKDYFIYESESEECGICIETGEIVDSEKIEKMGW